MPADHPTLIGTKRTDPTKVKVPARFAAPDEETTSDLLESIGSVGQLQPIGIDRKGSLLFGLHRLTVCRRLGIRVRAEVWDASDPVMAERLSITENLRRRDLPAAERGAAIRRLAELQGNFATAVAKIEPAESLANSDEPADPPARKERGRPRNEAKRAIAKVSGVSTRTVERALAANEPAAKNEPKEPPPVPVDELGNVLPPDVSEAYQETTAIYDAIDSHLGALVALEGKLKAGGEGHDQQRSTRWREQIQGLRREHRANAPYSICPYCKLVAKYRKACNHCGGEGFVGKAAHDSALDALRIFGPDAVIMVGKGPEQTLTKVADL